MPILGVDNGIVYDIQYVGVRYTISRSRLVYV